MWQIKLKYILLLVPLLSLIGGCGPSSLGSQTPCDTPSKIRGTIVAISKRSSGSGNYIGGILIDGTKEKQKAEFDKVNISAHTATQIFEKQGQACNAVSFAALKVGQRVQVQSTGIVRQIYPPEVDATTIVILPPQG
jgi:hypothetical protein